MVSLQRGESHEILRGSLIEAACAAAPEISRPAVVRIVRAVARYQQQSLLRELSGFQPLLSGRAGEGDSKLSDVVQLYVAEHVSRGRWTPRNGSPVSWLSVAYDRTARGSPYRRCL